MAENEGVLLEIQDRIEEIARLLPHVSSISSLDEESQRTLNELIDEMATVLRTGELPDEELDHISATTNHLLELLRNHEKVGVLARAQEGIQRAIGEAEAKAPIAVGFARRLLDALANIGI